MSVRVSAVTGGSARGKVRRRLGRPRDCCDRRFAGGARRRPRRGRVSHGRLRLRQPQRLRNPGCSHPAQRPGKRCGPLSRAAEAWGPAASKPGQAGLGISRRGLGAVRAWLRPHRAEASSRSISISGGPACKGMPTGSGGPETGGRARTNSRDHITGSRESRHRRWPRCVAQQFEVRPPPRPCHAHDFFGLAPVIVNREASALRVTGIAGVP